MSSVLSIAQSGMSAAALGLRASAHNIANLGTEGFRRQLVVQQAQADGGVSAQLRPAPEGGNALEQDLVQQKMLTYAFKANAMSIKAEDERLGTLLDLHA